ncbi:hypothetical protein Q3G72_012578 [Acer saccharum]|nr:hypothetical protein Q3G72_012578 [Acer saccharum]
MSVSVSVLSWTRRVYGEEVDEVETAKRLTRSCAGFGVLAMQVQTFSINLYFSPYRPISLGFLRIPSGQRGEEVIVQGADAGQIEEGAATVVEMIVVVVVRGGVLAGDVEVGDKGLERDDAVDEGGEEVGAVLDEGAEGKEEERDVAVVYFISSLVLQRWRCHG